jgi:hypothetical protein
MTKGINPAASYTCYANVKAKNPSRPVDESMLIHVIRSNRELRPWGYNPEIPSHYNKKTVKM